MAITIVSGGVLGLVYGLTKPTIEKVDAEKNSKAIALVLQTENGKDIANIIPDTIDGMIYNRAYDANNAFIGAAVKTESLNGFGGKIELMVGILADNTINKVSVLQQAETPGLGANMSKDGNKLMNSINGQSIDEISTLTDGTYSVKVTKDAGKIDALTAATISSRAVCEAVEVAVNGFMTNKEKFMEGGNNE